MLIDPGCHIGDAWFHVDPSGLAHCFYLVCPESVPRHAAWDIAHATSHDLVDWDRHGVAVRRGADDEWDGGCLATGSAIATPDGYLMAYTARWAEPGVATGLATSRDLFTWSKHPANPATRPGPPYRVGGGQGGRPGTHWRDPFLTDAGEGGMRQLLCAARTDRPDDASGTVAVVEGDPTRGWRCRPPLEVEAVARELECPQVHHLDGRWFLLFSSAPALFSDEVRAEVGGLLRAGAYAMVGDGPDGPFRWVQRRPIVPAEDPVQPYAAQLVSFGGRHWLLGTVWCDDGPDHVSDPVPVARVGDHLVVG